VSKRDGGGNYINKLQKLLYRVFLESSVIQLNKKLPVIMESKSSLICSQKLASEIYPEPAQSNRHIYNLFL
jgi:hypothetical protein